MIYKDSMAMKFIKLFILLIVIPIFIINLALNQLYKNVLLNQYSQKAQQVIDQITIDIESQLKRISLSAATLSQDKEMVSLMENWNDEKDPGLKFSLSKKIDSKLNYLFNFTNDVHAIVFFLKDEGYYYYKAPLKMDEEEIRKEKWYIRGLCNKGKVFNLGTLQGITNNGSQKAYLSASISPDFLESHNPIETIYLQFRTSVFDSIYARYDKDQIGKMIIFDTEGNILVAWDKKLMGSNVKNDEALKEVFYTKQKVFTKVVDGNKKFISTNRIQNGNWKIANMIDYEILTQDMDYIFKYFIGLFFIIILLFIIFSALFFKDMIKPIKTLIEKMKSVEKGNFDDEIKADGTREIIELGGSFNKMIYEIKKLMVERDLKEKERSREEIKALQAQINPHFIYNTLNSIRLMAMIAKIESIKNMTDAFMKLLCATFKDENTLISIEEEMDYLKHYVYIMQVRYGDNFAFHIDLEEDLKDLKIIKLILQPIVENAILHGISQMEEKGMIHVRAYREKDDLIFEVTDNGVGMSEEKIKKLLEEKIHRKGFNHIGIANVDKRIKLNHGKDYGLFIESIEKKYTTVKIVLPAIEGDKICIKSY